VDVSAVAAVELQSGGGAKATTVAKKSAGRASERGVPNIEVGHALVVDTQTGNGIFPSHESVTDWVASQAQVVSRRLEMMHDSGQNAFTLPGSKTTSRTVIVNNFPEDVSQQQAVMQKMAATGTVTDTYTMRQNGAVIVEFETPEHAAEAVKIKEHGIKVLVAFMTVNGMRLFDAKQEERDKLQREITQKAQLQLQQQLEQQLQRSRLQEQQEQEQQEQRDRDKEAAAKLALEAEVPSERIIISDGSEEDDEEAQTPKQNQGKGREIEGAKTAAATPTCQQVLGNTPTDRDGEQSEGGDNGDEQQAAEQTQGKAGETEQHAAPTFHQLQQKMRRLRTKEKQATAGTGAADGKERTKWTSSARVTFYRTILKLNPWRTGAEVMKVFDEVAESMRAATAAQPQDGRVVSQGSTLYVYFRDQVFKFKSAMKGEATSSGTTGFSESAMEAAGFTTADSQKQCMAEWKELQRCIDLQAHYAQVDKQLKEAKEQVKGAANKEVTELTMQQAATNKEVQKVLWRRLEKDKKALEKKSKLCKMQAEGTSCAMRTVICLRDTHN
jgi:hypothetical protein